MKTIRTLYGYPSTPGFLAKIFARCIEAFGRAWVSPPAKRRLKRERAVWTSLLLLAAAGPVSAERLMDNYEELRKSEEAYSSTLYFLDVIQDTAAEVGPREAAVIERPVPSADRGDVVRRVREAWEKKLSELPSPRLFIDTSSAEFQRAKQLTNVEELNQALSGPVTLELLEAITFERNPKLRELRESWRLACEKLARALYLDNILQQYKASSAAWGPAQASQETLPPFIEPPRPMLTLKGEVALQEILIEEKKFEIGVRDLMTELRQAYNENLYLLQAIRIARDSQTLLTDFESAARKKYEHHAASLLDVLKAQVELSKIGQELVTLEENHKTVLARLNTLVARSWDAPLGTPSDVVDVPLPLPLADIHALAIRERQEFHLLELQIKRMGLVAEVVSRATYPDPDAEIGPPGEDTVSPGAEAIATPAFDLRRDLKPVFWFGINDAPLLELYREIEILRQELAGMRDVHHHFDVSEALFRIDEARRQRDLHRTTLLSQASQSLDSARIAYQSGTASILDLLDAQRSWLDFNLAHHGFIRDYRMNFSKLEQLVGKRLTGPGIQK